MWVWLLTSTSSMVRVVEFSMSMSPPMWSAWACVAITRCMCVMLRLAR